MSALIGKAGKTLFARHLEQYAPADPLYETYTNEKGKQKRRQRALPSGLSKRDARILKSVQRRAHYLDKGFNLCGFRFGWNFFIGLIPVVGDVTNMSLNHLLVIRKAKQADIPPWLLQRMQMHNIVSTGVGFIPVVGDVVVAVYKANSRNAALLEEFLRIRGEEFLKLNAGEDGRPSSATGNSRKKGEAWFRRKGVSPKDAEQVKPGAGFTQDEAVPSASSNAEASYAGGGQTTGASSSSGNRDLIQEKPAATSTSQNVTPSQANSRKGFSLFGGGKQKTIPTSSSPTEGRFVENIGAEGAPMSTK